jgi:hypothetical protein
LHLLVTRLATQELPSLLRSFLARRLGGLALCVSLAACGDGAADLTLRGEWNAQRVKPGPASLRALSNREYVYSASALFGLPLPLSLTTDWSPNPQFSGFDSIQWSNFDAKLVRDRLGAVETIVEVAVKSPSVMTCAAATDADVAYAACAQTLLQTIATRAFRRPLEGDEVAGLKAVYDEAVALARSAPITAPHELVTEGLRAGLASILLAPQFMVRGELPPSPAFEGERSLDAYELASKLSFFFTSALPDDALWADAESGALLGPSVVAHHAERLLGAHPERFVEAFMGQWLGVRDLSDAPPGSLEHAMWMETKLTLMDLLKSNVPVSRVLKPGFTYVNSTLAGHYELEGTFQPDSFTRVSTQSRGGALMLASVLTTTSTPVKTSPIRRGRYVQGRILCKTLPTPGPELFEQIKAVANSIPATATVKERMTQHRTASEICQTCHQYMDPIGLGLEGFDPRGRLRTVYDGDPTKPVETDSTLLGKPFQTFQELNELLLMLPDVHRCVAEKVAIYALGRVLDTQQEADKDLVNYLSGTGEGPEPSFRTLIRRMVTSNAFLKVNHTWSAE